MMKALKSQAKAGASARLSRIIGRNASGNAKDDDEGAEPVAKAKKAAAPVTVDGNAAKPRLDRPGRRMKRADGGEVIEPRKRAAGELDEGAQRDYLKAKAAGAAGERESERNDKTPVTALGLGLATALGARSRIAKGLGALAAGAGTVAGAKSMKRQDAATANAKRWGDEAKEFDKADMAERKDGGRAKR